MTTETSTKAKWPTVIGALSVIYMLLYATLYVRPPEDGGNLFPILQNIGICLLLVSGGIGVGLRRKWGVLLLLIGSVLVLSAAAFSLFLIIMALGASAPIFVLLGVVTLMLPTIAWPGFLIYWFSRSSTRSAIQEQWT
jgi:hypothetical protein